MDAYFLFFAPLEVDERQKIIFRTLPLRQLDDSNTRRLTEAPVLISVDEKRRYWDHIFIDRLQNIEAESDLSSQAVTGRRRTAAAGQFRFNLAQQLKYALIRMTFPNHRIALRSLKIVVKF